LILYYTFVFQTSVIDSTSIHAEAYHFPTIFKNYVARNFTTYLNAPYTMWSGGRGADQPFVLSATIAYPEELFNYTPGFWYLIKWGWVQYVSVLLLFLFVFDRIKVFIYQNQLVTTMVDRPWKEEIKLS
jgi:transmembrane protein 231